MNDKMKKNNIRQYETGYIPDSCSKCELSTIDGNVIICPLLKSEVTINFTPDTLVDMNEVKLHDCPLVPLKEDK